MQIPWSLSIGIQWYHTVIHFYVIPKRITDLHLGIGIGSIHLFTIDCSPRWTSRYRISCARLVDRKLELPWSFIMILFEFTGLCRSSALNWHQFGRLLSAGAAVKKLLFRTWPGHLVPGELRNFIFDSHYPNRQYRQYLWQERHIPSTDFITCQHRPMITLKRD